MKAYVFSENQTRAVEIEEDTSLAKEEFEFFDDQTVRKVWHIDEEEWYFAIYDIVAVLTDSSDPKQYIKKMRTRDKELNSKWGTICTPLPMIAHDGKMRRIQASNTEGLFRIIQSIPSPKAEPLKVWLAKVGAERLDEYADPEKAIDRAVATYQAKGYSDKWMPHGDGVKGSFLKSRDIRLCDYLQKFYDIPVGLICVCAIFQFGFPDN